MKAFQKNINALETKIELLIQKWKEAREENKLLIERTRELEEELRSERTGLTDEANNASDRTELSNKIKLDNIEQILDSYVDKIDACLDLINIEMNGK